MVDSQEGDIAAASPEPPSDASRVGGVVRVVLFNAYFLALGLMALLLVPVRANFTPIRHEVMQVDERDIRLNRLREIADAAAQHAG